MRRFALPLALATAAAVIAFPAQAQTQDRQAEREKDDKTGPVACIYYGLKKGDWPMLVKVVRSGMNGETSAEKVLVDQIGQSTARCRARYGWGRPRESAALRYFAGRVLGSDSTFHLKKYGLTYPKLVELVDLLDPATRRAYVSNQVTSEQSAETMAALAKVGIDFNAVPAEERAAFAHKLAQGILGQILQLEGQKAFNEA
ncbi:hypothetical protein P1X14_02055 [Sphingomonas sp. AOB5]|uniref:hypothetical protein n=1 Tax=Sphingomonas sp. AOB5 TaxID=3034017 RepID=UPI0023F66E9F|nr:hypothetical protein [Sphingomonas sp. AOB5]MDF7774017.1 hypothetical protein [Sphingomonas sp. AOB5]